MSNKSIKITCWNVNSIKARLPLVKLFISQHNPDILVLQETKSTDHTFPLEEFEPSYKCYIHGQSAYNGVAVLVKENLHVKWYEILQLDVEQARCIKVDLENFSVMSVYVPCGDGLASAQLRKTNFMKNLIQYLNGVKNQNIIIAGDFNVALTSKDLECPEKFIDSPLCLPEFRSLLSEMTIKNDLIDMYVPSLNATKHDFTWWHYFGYKSKGSQIYTGGVRIDYIFTTRTMFESIKDPCFITHQNYRDITIKSFSKSKEMETKPSDHIPISLIFNQIF